MADKTMRKISPKQLQEDVAALDALAAISNYKPSNDAYARTKAETLVTETKAVEAKAVQDEAQAKASRDAMVAKQWERHDFVLGMKRQIEAQFGSSSDQLAAVGLKKKSEYKAPKPKKAKVV